MKAEHERSRYISRFEKLPPDVFKAVHLNHGLLEPSTGVLAQFRDPNWVKEAVGYFALGNPIIPDREEIVDGKKVTFSGTPKDNIKVHSPDTHRGYNFLFSRGVSDEFGNYYSQIGVKGTGVARRSSSFTYFHNTAGLFGVRHAEQDMEISDNVAFHGGKTSRGVAILEFNHEELREWAEHTGVDHEYNFTGALDWVEHHGDKAALYVRLLGADRYHESSRARNPNRRGEIGKSGIELKYFYDLSPYSHDAITTRAFLTVLQEVQESGIGEYQAQYCMPEYVVQPLRYAIENPLLVNQKKALLYLNAYFFNFNKGVFDIVNVEHYGSTLKKNIHLDNQDIVGGWVDWENSHPKSGQQLSNMSEGYKDEISQDQAQDFHIMGSDAYIAGRRVAHLIHEENCD